MLKYFKNRILLKTLKSTFSGHPQVNYTPDKKNTESHIFNFTPENELEVIKILKKYPNNYKKSGVIPLLFLAQKQTNNHLTLSAMQKVAEIIQVPYMDVYEVASFYTMFNRTKVGKYHLQVCGTTPCMVRGGDKIIKKLESHLGIKNHGTTKDGLFTITEVECLGACVNAPMLQVNNEWVYEDLDEDNVVELVEKFRRGETVKKGPQNHRVNSEGPDGRTSLFCKEEVEQVVERDFDGEKKRYLEEKEAAQKK